MMTAVTTGALVIESAEQVGVLTHPTRLRVLDALRSPDSAAGVARRIGEPRQRINHHVRALADAGLLRDAGERRKGNFVEQLYESVAGTFVFSPRIVWGDGERLAALSDQLSLQHLVELSERLQRDAVDLLDRAAFDGESIPSAAVEAEVHFADATARAAFLDEYLELTKALIERHAGDEGAPYTVALAVHPSRQEQS